MEQPGPPSPDNLPVPYYRQGLSTVPQRVQPNRKLDSGWGVLVYPPDIHSGAYTQILGTRYALSDLTDIYLRMIHGERWHDNEERTLFDLLKMDPADRRMWYRAYLEQAILAAHRDNSPDFPYLLAERIQWADRDLEEMNARLQDGFQWHSLHYYLTQPDACWIWHGRLERSRKYPTVASWRMMKHITVHRLLWPIVWPDSPFTSRPVRSDERCVNPSCVNPRHFIDPSKRTRARNQGPGKGYKLELRTGSSISFGPEHAIAQGDGTFKVICPGSDPPHLAPEKYWIMAENYARVGILGQFKGKLHCPICYQLYKAYKAGSERHGFTRTPDVLHSETQHERIAREVKALNAPNDGYPEFQYPERQTPIQIDEDQPAIQAGWPDDFDLDQRVKDMRKRPG